MKKSYVIAIGMTVALVLWIASGYFSKDVPAGTQESVQLDRETLMKVRVKTFNIAKVNNVVFVQGQLEPWRSVK